MSRLLVALAMLTPMSLSAAGDPHAGFLRTLAETRNFSLGRPVKPTPTADGKAVLFLRSTARSPEQSLWEFDVASGKLRELLSPKRLLQGGTEQLSAEERARRERQRVATSGFTTFDLSADGALVLLSLSGRLHLHHRADGRTEALATGRTPVLDPRFSPDGKRLAYVRDRDLYVYEIATQRETRLTRSADPLVTNGLAEFVAQEEMSRFVGFWWSPDSALIAFEEADSRGLETFHLGDALHPEVAPVAVAYPRPGHANARLRVGVIGVGGGEVTWLRWEEHRLPYLAKVVWRERGPLTLVVMSREQQDLEVLAADPKSGRTRRLLAEHDAAWVNLDPSLPRWLPDGSAFLWSSERSGSHELELRDAAGTLVRTLGGGMGYLELLAVDGERRVALVQATREPTETHLARVPLDGGAVEWLTGEPGKHVASFGEQARVGALVTATSQHLDRASVFALDAHGLVKRGELPSVAEEPPFVPRTELGRIGPRELRFAITRPHDFDPAKRYPVVLDVYGGPHHLHVGRALSLTLMAQWIADHGFVVVSLDGRGTPRRGREFERAIRLDFAGPTLTDQVEGLQALGARYGELDLARVGAYGWSFGGYMAALAVLARPDVFRVAVAGAPVVDWRDYDTCYTERYLGLLGPHGEAYEKSSLLPLAPRLERPLLLVHGTADDNVYFLHTLKLADALFRAGRPFELLPLPGFTHMVPDPVVKERLYTRIVDTFVRALHP